MNPRNKFKNGSGTFVNIGANFVTAAALPAEIVFGMKGLAGIISLKKCLVAQKMGRTARLTAPNARPSP
jgi:hypothetical protein